MGEEIKSTIDLVMEKLEAGQKTGQTLSEDEKRKISELRKTYEAKIAEARILLAGDERLPHEIARLERLMAEKIEAVKRSKS